MKNINDELINKTAEVYKENLENLTRPTSKSIGDNVGEMIEGVFGWLGAWGEIQKIKQKKYVEDFKDKFEDEFQKIDETKVVEPKMNIVGPTLETAKFYYDEEYYQEMFAKILAKSCSSEHLNDIHPAFVETIKQLSPLDAKIIRAFKHNSTYPIAEVKAKKQDGTIKPFAYILSDFKNLESTFSRDEKILVSTAIENLCRLGIITKNRAIIELKYDYEKFLKIEKKRDLK